MTRLPMPGMPALPTMSSLMQQAAAPKPYQSRYRSRPQSRAMSPDEESGATQSLVGQGLGTVAALGNVLDLPGSSVRDTLSGRNPFDQWLPWNMTTADTRISGRDMARELGWAGKEDNWRNFWGGLGVEIALDPLTYVGGFGAATKALGLVGKAGVKGSSIAAAATAKAAAKAGAGKLGRKIGVREARATSTIEDILRFGDSASRDAITGTLKRKYKTDSAADALNMMVDGKRLGDTPLTSAWSVDVPLYGPVKNFGSAAGKRGMAYNRAMDTAGAWLSNTKVARAGRGLFDAASQGFFKKHHQELARKADARRRVYDKIAAKASLEFRETVDEYSDSIDEVFGLRPEMDNALADPHGLQVGDVVKSSDLDNYGRVTKIADDETTVFFRNPETGASREIGYKAGDAAPAYKMPDGSDVNLDVTHRRGTDEASAWRKMEYGKVAEDILRFTRETGDVDSAFALYLPKDNPVVAQWRKTMEFGEGRDFFSKTARELYGSQSDGFMPVVDSYARTWAMAKAGRTADDFYKTFKGGEIYDTMDGWIAATKKHSSTGTLEQRDLRGEFWLEGGSVRFADGAIGDNHEVLALAAIRRDLADKLGFDDADDFQSVSEMIAEAAHNNPEALREVENYSPELLEMARYNGNVDPRLYAARHYGWTRMAGNNLETFRLNSAKLKQIADDIYEAGNDELEGRAGYEIEKQTFDLFDHSTGKFYEDVTWDTLEAGDMKALRDNDSAIGGSKTLFQRFNETLGPKATRAAKSTYRRIPEEAQRAALNVEKKQGPEVANKYLKMLSHYSDAELDAIANKNPTALKSMEMFYSNTWDRTSIKALAQIGESVGGEYKRGAAIYKNLLGTADARRFAALRSAFSAQTVVEKHDQLALDFLVRWKASDYTTDDAVIDKLLIETKNAVRARVIGISEVKGEPVIKATGTHVKNIKRVVNSNTPDAGELRAGSEEWMKQPNFQRATEGKDDPLPLDTWMARAANWLEASMLMFGGKKLLARDGKAAYKLGGEFGKNWLYASSAAVFREVAKKMGIAPAQIQEQVWGGIIALSVHRERLKGLKANNFNRLLDALQHDGVAGAWDATSLFRQDSFKDLLRKGWDVSDSRLRQLTDQEGAFKATDSIKSGAIKLSRDERKSLHPLIKQLAEKSGYAGQDFKYGTDFFHEQPNIPVQRNATVQRKVKGKEGYQFSKPMKHAGTKRAKRGHAWVVDSFDEGWESRRFQVPEDELIVGRTGMVKEQGSTVVPVRDAIPGDILYQLRGFEEQRFPFVQSVRVEWPDGTFSYDQVKGLNSGHALSRAKNNWPDASSVTKSTDGEYKLFAESEDATGSVGGRADSQRYGNMMSVDGSNHEDILYQTAWHGSPHEFDKFDSSKIGTGEGAAAYGHGLYFTETEDIARYYKDTLSSRPVVKYKGELATRVLGGSKRDHVTQLSWLLEGGQSFDDALAKQMESIELDLRRADDKFRHIDGLKREGRLGKPVNPERWGNLSWDEADWKRAKETLSDQEDVYRFMSDLKEGDVSLDKGTGRLYKVDLAPADDDYLKWDLPLSEQSDVVKKAFRERIGPDGSGITDEFIAAKGSPEFWEAQKRYLESNWNKPAKDVYHDLSKSVGGKVAASDELRKAGIRGIKYFDGSSRASVMNARSQVTWIQNRIAELRKKIADQPDTAPRLKRLSRMELRYVDQLEKAKQAAKGKNNFVIFDDADVTIQDIFHQGRGNTAKAAVAFNAQKESIFAAFRNAKTGDSSGDLTSFIHETSHIFRRHLADIDPQLLRDAESGVLDQLARAGRLNKATQVVDADGRWTEEAEEVFAESFELYMRSGKSPTRKLERVFKSLKQWLKTLYQGIRSKYLGADGKNIDQLMSPELRKVFDSMLSGDEIANLALRDQTYELAGKLHRGMLKALEPYEEMGGDVSMIDAVSYQYAPRSVDKKLADKLGLGKTREWSVQIDAARARQPAIRTLPAGIVNLLLTDPQVREEGYDYILKKYGRYLDAEFHGKGMGDDIKPNKWWDKDAFTHDGKVYEGVEAHAWAIDEWLKGRKSHEMFTKNLTDDFMRYQKQLARARGNLEAFHETLADPASYINAGDEGFAEAPDIASVFRSTGMTAKEGADGPLKALVHLAEKTQTNVDELAKMRVQPDLADAFVSLQKLNSDPEWFGVIGEGIDKVMRYWKAGVTVGFGTPSFQLRNLVSGQHVNMASGLMETPRDVGDYAKFAKFAKELLNKARKDIKSLTTDDRDLLRELEAYEVLGHGIDTDIFNLRTSKGVVPERARDVRTTWQEQSQWVANNPLFGADASGGKKPWGKLERLRRGLEKIRTAARTGAYTGGKLNQQVEWFNRVPLYLYLKKQGWDPIAAAHKVEELHFDYSRLTPFEKQGMRRLVPFYTFSRRIAPVIWKRLLEKPGGAMGQTVRGYNYAGMEAQRQQEAPLPNYLKDQFTANIGTASDGSPRYLTGGGLAIEDTLGFGPDVRNTLLEGMSRMNPMIKAPLEMATGQSFFQRGPMGPRELASADPPIGRLMSNLGELTGLREEGKGPVKTNQTFELLMSNLPTSRGVTRLRSATDPRKLGSPTDIFYNALNQLTGFRVTDISPAAQTRATREAAFDRLKGMGAGTFKRAFFSADEKEAMPKEERAEAERMQRLISAMQKRNKLLREQREREGR
jgi:hypothetical protein